MGYYDNYLEHHGILGQKWGVRRYQNKDGSLTEAGKKMARKGAIGRSELLKKGEAKARNKRIGGSIKSALATPTGTAAGAAAGAALGSSLGPVGIAGGAVAGGLVGLIGGKIAKPIIKELAKEKANAISNEYMLLANDVMKEYGNVKVKDISHGSDTKSDKSIKEKVSNSKKTGKYDMEFLERGLDLNSKTGEPLQGKALDEAYEKYLKNK